MLPSLKALRAFDVAAELGSFRAAAEYLSISPTAISHHIRNLEDQLGTKLFDRMIRAVELTDDGRYLAQVTHQAFGSLEHSVERLRRSRTNSSIRIAAGSFFTARKLLPLISEFWQHHPEIELEVTTYRPSDIARNDAEITIQWERIEDAPAASHRLLELQPVAVASPVFIQQQGQPQQPQDLLNLSLIHQRDLHGWRDWFNALNIETDPQLRGSVFEDANIVLRAAVSGQGIIIGWLPLFEAELREAKLIRLFNEDIKPTHAYFLVTHESFSNKAEVQTVVDWLTKNIDC
jgi:LysR family glycine cleavage system transcriptional activator